MPDPAYRHSYVASHSRQFLARQMRALRGERSQTEFGDEIGRAQTMISRLEDPNYHGWTLQTMFDIAAKQDVAVLVRFVDFPTFLKFTEAQSDSMVRPEPYHQEPVDALAAHENDACLMGAWRSFLTKPGQETGTSAAKSFGQGSPMTISASASHDTELPPTRRVA
jgi:hypothetical protein